jgi:translation initiation factor 2 alpha subunit (eIF-2alpha)
MRMSSTLRKIGFLLAIGTMTVACAEESKVRNELLQKTPVGTSFNEVLAYCTNNSLKCRQSNTAGYLNQKTGETVGVKSIWAVLSEKKEAPLRISSVSAYWGFDKEGKLLDVWVWKTVDAP